MRSSQNYNDACAFERSSLIRSMIIVDNLLKERASQANPIKVAILGSGFMAQGLTNQITRSAPAMDMVAIYGRRPQRAIHVLTYSGLENPIEAATQSQLDEAIRSRVGVDGLDAGYRVLREGHRSRFVDRRAVEEHIGAGRMNDLAQLRSADGIYPHGVR